MKIANKAYLNFRTWRGKEEKWMHSGQWNFTCTKALLLVCPCCFCKCAVCRVVSCNWPGTRLFHNNVFKQLSTKSSERVALSWVATSVFALAFAMNITVLYGPHSMMFYSTIICLLIQMCVCVIVQSVCQSWVQ